MLKEWLLRNRYKLVKVIIFVAVFIAQIPLKMNPSASLSRLSHVEFEVFGTVQGVFFRKYTQQESNNLGLKGWCMNTSRGTVKGVLEGEEANVAKMKNWLSNVGSPSSKIEKVQFSNERPINAPTFKGFSIKR